MSAEQRGGTTQLNAHLCLLAVDAVGRRPYQVERWFGIITQRAIRRGIFSSIKELIAKIEQFAAAYDKTKATFKWTATADSILETI